MGHIIQVLHVHHTKIDTRMKYVTIGHNYVLMISCGMLSFTYSNSCLSASQQCGNGVCLEQGQGNFFSFFLAMESVAKKSFFCCFFFNVTVILLPSCMLY